jgi:ribonuclease P protein component
LKILSIKSRQEILESRNNGKVFTTANFTIIKTPINKSKDVLVRKMLDKNDDFVRLLVVVSKKIDKRAVIRNKIRRRVKEVFRLNENFQNHFDTQIIVKRNIINIKFNDLKKEIKL